VEGRLEKEETLPFDIIKAVEDLFGGQEAQAERAVQRLSGRFDSAEVENWVNRLGYWLMRGEKGGEALELFEFNTRLFPKSWNAWDKLGEAYFNLGHKEEALKAYQKSLKLNPGNKNAEKRIAFIERSKKNKK